MKKIKFTSSVLCLILSLAIQFRSIASPIIAVDEIVQLTAPCGIPSGDGTFQEADWVETLVFTIPTSGISAIKHVQINKAVDSDPVFARFLIWVDSDEMLHFQEKETDYSTSGTRDPEDHDGSFDEIDYDGFFTITAEVSGSYLNCYIKYTVDSRIKSCQSGLGFAINSENSWTANAQMYQNTGNAMQIDKGIGQNLIESPATLFITPNPVQNRAYLSYNLTGNQVKISVYNSLGRLVKQVDGANNNGLYLEVESFPQGVYYVMVQTKEEFLLNRLMKQ